MFATTAIPAVIVLATKMVFAVFVNVNPDVPFALPESLKSTVVFDPPVGPEDPV